MLTFIFLCTHSWEAIYEWYVNLFIKYALFVWKSSSFKKTSLLQVHQLHWDKLYRITWWRATPSKISILPVIPASIYFYLVYFPKHSSYEPAPPSSQKERINLTSPSHSREPRTKRTANKESILQLSFLHTRHKHSAQCPPSITVYHIL